MIWNIDFGDRPWYRWFAWYPVRLSWDESDQRVWLQWIWRRIDNVQGYHIARYRVNKPTEGPRNP